MRIKTSELSGAALDWAVAMIEQESDNKLTITRREDYTGWPIVREVSSGSAPEYERWSPVRIWSQGGPILGRERITIRHWDNEPFVTAYMPISGSLWVHGKDPLEAAMRCYVASKLGEYMDVPDEVQS